MQRARARMEFSRLVLAFSCVPNALSGRFTSLHRFTDRTLIAPTRKRHCGRPVLVGRALLGQQSATPTQVGASKASSGKDPGPAAADGVAPTVERRPKIDILSPLTVIVFIFSQMFRFVLRALLFLMVFIGVTVFLWLRRGQMWLHERGRNVRGAAAMCLQRRQMRIPPLAVAGKQPEATSGHTSTQLPMDQKDKNQPGHQDASPDEPDSSEGLSFSWNWNLGYALSSLLQIDFSRCWFLLWRFGSRK